MSVERLDHIGIVVDDLTAATEFLLALGLERKAEWEADAPEVGSILGVDGVHSRVAMLSTPDGSSDVELSEFISPPGPAADPAPANAPGLRHLCFAIDDVEATLAALRPHGAELVGKVEDYGGYRLCYVRGPAGIILELAQKLD